MAWPWDLGWGSHNVIETDTIIIIIIITDLYSAFRSEDTDTFESLCNVYGFLFAFHSNNVSILYHFRDTAGYWLTIAIFSYPLHLTPPLGVPVRILLYRPFGKEKLEWCGFPMVKKVWGNLLPFRQNTGVWQTDRWTNRRTDGQTSCNSIVTAMNSIAP